MWHVPFMSTRILLCLCYRFVGCEETRDSEYISITRRCVPILSNGTRPLKDVSIQTRLVVPSIGFRPIPGLFMPKT